MIIKVNNENVEVEDNTTVSQLIDRMQLATGGLAVACNGVIVKRGEWSAHRLKPDDDILLIKAAYGG